MATATLPIPAEDLSGLADKTFFLRVSFGLPGNFRKVDVEVNSDAVESRMKHQKKLLDSPELDAIRKADAEMRLRLDAKCLPYGEGIRLIPASPEAVEEIYSILTEYEILTRPALIDAFMAVYETQKEQARQELKELFSEADYPKAAVMRSRFAFTYKLFSFAVPGKLKSLSPAIYKAEVEKAHQSIVEMANEVVLAMRAAAHELVSHLLDKLTPTADGKTKRLHATSITALTEFINNFDIRNVSDDTQLKSEIDKLREIMDGADVEKLRHSDNYKTEMHQKLAHVAEVLGTLVEVKGRKFRD